MRGYLLQGQGEGASINEIIQATTPGPEGVIIKLLRQYNLVLHCLDVGVFIGDTLCKTYEVKSNT